ncbi:MAG TPA: hypothetical protein VLK23_07210 [Thermodesulfobacteriota bacterium]|nr:hypothetical protein [Thermodesulfobacteriota bacterium]
MTRTDLVMKALNILIGEKTTIIMIYDSNMGGGLTISSTEFTDQKAKEEKE